MDIISRICYYYCKIQDPSALTMRFLTKPLPFTCNCVLASRFAILVPYPVLVVSYYSIGTWFSMVRDNIPNVGTLWDSAYGTLCPVPGGIGQYGRPWTWRHRSSQKRRKALWHPDRSQISCWQDHRRVYNNSFLLSIRDKVNNIFPKKIVREK